MEKIKVGVVGMGDGGMSNFRALRQIPEAEVEAVCDERKEALKEVSGIAKYELFENLVQDPDIELVVVATPDHLHLEVAKAALEAGKYVFCEKPLATTFADLVVFKELAGEYPGKLLFSEKYSFAYPVQAALAHREELGEFMIGSTFYTMWKCDRIMGEGKWRTETAYNPCAGGLSHNFMTALLFVRSPIVRVRATGQILTYYENLDKYGGFDTMKGTLEFQNGKYLNWLICLAVQGKNSPFVHRTITHTFQFRDGALVYGPPQKGYDLDMHLEYGALDCGHRPESDKLIVNGSSMSFIQEPLAEKWSDYNLNVLYRRMHENILGAVAGTVKPLHTVEDGINVAAACVLAFVSAKHDGIWYRIPEELRF